MSRLLPAVAMAVLTVALVFVPTTPPRVNVPRSERNRFITISGTNGAPPRLGLAAIAVAPAAQGRAAVGTAGQSPASQAPEPSALARLVEEVLRKDLEFEGAFTVLAGDATAPGEKSADAAGKNSAPPRAGYDDKPRDVTAELSHWRAAGADGLLAATLQPQGDAIEIDVRVYKVSTGEEGFARGYVARAPSARVAAHTIADELHQLLAHVRGIAHSRLAFVSDRGGMRRELGGMMRRFKEVWAADYDGTNERRVTSDGDLDMTPTWSPDGRAIAYTSLRPGFQDIFVTLLDDHRVLNPTRGTGTNRLPAWSPDGAHLAFSSVRDGNEEIYVINRDGSGTRRLTHHGAIDTAPAWSPDGRQIAFTSNRTGSPQIWVMNADGSNPRALTGEKYCDRPTWSPPPYNEIAYVSKTKTGFDIKVIDVATRESRQLTFGHGFNESPAFSPNGRHIAFSSTRRGGQQIWVISRTGDALRQVTTIGNNTMPAWR